MFDCAVSEVAIDSDADLDAAPEAEILSDLAVEIAFESALFDSNEPLLETEAEVESELFESLVIEIDLDVDVEVLSTAASEILRDSDVASDFAADKLSVPSTITYPVVVSSVPVAGSVYLTVNEYLPGFVLSYSSDCMTV